MAVNPSLQSYSQKFIFTQKQKLAITKGQGQRIRKILCVGGYFSVFIYTYG